MLKRMLLVASALAAFAASSGRAAPITAQGAEDRLIVGFRDGVAFDEGRRIAEARGLKIVGEIPEMNLLLVQARHKDFSAAEAGLVADPNVRGVERDVWTKWIETSPESMAEAPLPTLEAARQSLPKYSAPTVALRTETRNPVNPGPNEVQWGVKRVDAPAAWETNQGEGVKVCVVDTGIDDTNPDLAGQVAGGYNAVDHGGSWADDHFHGTHVAGIIAAKLDGRGVVGVAPKATLYAVKVLTKDGSGSVFSIMDGINWCAKNHMDVINMSLGAAQNSPFFESAVKSAYKKGITIVAAAGNGVGDGKPGPVDYPAAYPECIAVSALDEHDGITPWSSRGPEIGFIAPGHKILSTVPTFSDPTGYHAYSGTSMASPHVAGLAALAIAAGARGPEAVRAMLTRAAAKIPNLSPEEQGNGVIDAAKLAR